MTGREHALAVFRKYNDSDSLFRHALAVEAVMRHFAGLYGEDPEYWGAVGLLHDVDYEKYPDRHCQKAAEILGEEGYDDAFIHAVVSHGYGVVSDAEPISRMEKALFATDELTGLVAAAALMRPSRSVLDLEVSSLKKKWKDKKFAAGVDRNVIMRGCGMLGMELDGLMRETILAMRKEAVAIGLG